MSDVDQILRDHAADAAGAELAPDGWDHLVTRLAEDPSVRHGRVGGGGDRIGGDQVASRPGRGALAVAAGLLVVVAITAAVALTRSDGARTRTTAAAPSTETTPPSTERNHTPEEPRPDSILVVADGDGDGLDDVLLLEGSGVDEDASGPDGTAAPGDRLFEPTILVSGSDVAPASITSVDRGSDGTVMYAVGEAVWRIDPTSGLVSGPIAAGTAFAVSGDGETLATVVDGVIRVHRVDERGGRPFADLPMGGEVTALALSPDGSTIARQRVTRAGDGTIAGTAVDVTAVADPGGWSEVERSSGVGLPAFMPDGHLAVGLGTLGASQGHAEARASEVGMANLATGEVRWSVGGGGFSFTTFDATADGAWVLVVHEGAVRAFAAVDGWLSDSGSLVGVGLGIGDITDVAW